MVGGGAAEFCCFLVCFFRCCVVYNNDDVDVGLKIVKVKLLVLGINVERRWGRGWGGMGVSLLLYFDGKITIITLFLKSELLGATLLCHFSFTPTLKR